MGNAPFEYGFLGELVSKCLSHVLDRCVQTTEQGIIERVFRGRILEFPAVFAFDHFYGYGIFIVFSPSKQNFIYLFIINRTFPNKNTTAAESTVTITTYKNTLSIAISPIRNTPQSFSISITIGWIR